ncbi:MAG: CoA-binding protein [Candidatus Binatia bacterium]
MDESARAAHILRSFHRIAVVGLSDNPSRPSHGVASYLRAAGYEILPVNPRLRQWRDLPCYPDVRAVPPPVEVVDIFRRSELVEPIVADAIAAGARAIWMQDGVVNEAAAAAARAAGLLVIMDRCMLRDHRALR